MIVGCVVLSSVILAAMLCVYHAAPAARWRRGTVRPRVLLRALLPGRIVRSASGRCDIGFMLFSLLLAGTMIGWALWSSSYIAGLAHARLVETLAAPAPTTLPAWACIAIMTLALYLSYEFAYWLNHLLSHRWPLLWAFHKVHHSAESLSPLTNFRVHPVDTILFYDMVAVANGLTAAAVDFALGRHVDGLAVGGSNLLVFVGSIVLTNLQHTHLWISLPGRWGRVLLSPAHHQLHHSLDRRHHGRNFGSTLALFDWLGGTLRVPARRREPLRFGVEGLGYDPHSAAGAMLMPFVDARHGLGRWRRAVRSGDVTAAGT